jgi:hypothetical protein
MYTNLCNVAHNILSIRPHGGGVEASLSLVRDVISWRQSKTTGNTLYHNVELRLFARANIGILAGDYTALDSLETENDMEMKREVEEC